MAADNLILKGGMWHARFVIPVELREFFGKSQFSQSLKTGSKNEAQNRKIPFVKKWKTEIEAKRKELNNEDSDLSLGLSFDDFKEIAVDYIKAKKEKEEEKIKTLITQLITKRERFGEPELDSIEKEQKERHFHMWSANQLNDEERSNADEEINVWNVSYTSKLNDKGQLDFETTVEALKHVQRINEKLDLKMLIGELSQTHELTLKEKDEVVTAAQDPENQAPASPFSKQNLESFKKYQKEIRKVIDKTVDMQVSRLQKISDWLKSESLDLSHKSIRLYLDAQTDLTAKTKKQYILAGNTFYKWAMNNIERFEIKYQSVKAPFQNHEFPVARTGKAQKEGQRKNYTKEQIIALYEKASKMSGKNKQPLCDAIKIAAYTGMRIEEICKLEIKRDLVDDEGVYSFSLDDGKNISAIRKIPVHPKIKALIDRLKSESKDGFLIPSPAGNKYGIRSDYLSKAFGRLKTLAGYDSRYVFHSIRGTVITHFQRHNITGLTIASIVGHETDSVTFDIYSDGASAKQKQDAIATLDYDFG